MSKVLVWELTAGLHRWLSGSQDLRAHMGGAWCQRIFGGDEQPRDFLREGAPLWRSAQPGSLPENSFTAGKAFLLSGPVSFKKKPSPLLRCPLSHSEAVNRLLTWQSVGTFTAFRKCSKQNYMHSKFISVLKVKRKFYLCISTNFYLSTS